MASIGMHRTQNDPRRSLSPAPGRLLLSASALLLLTSCRMAEPDEIVTRPSVSNPTPSTGGSSSSTGGSTAAGGTSSGTGGSAGSPEAGGAAGAGTGGPTSVQCDPDPPIVTGAFTKKKLLEAAASCAVAHYCRFTAAAEHLRDATAALAEERNEDTLQAARDAWRAANASWQETEVFRFGPAAPSNEPGGQNLRDLIYAWPLPARCKVDEQTVSRFYATAQFTGDSRTSLANGRSLSALEYLLFYEGTDNGCNQFSAINSSGSWAALDEGELFQRKLDSAAAAAADLVANTVALVNAWDPAGGNFRAELVSAGAGSSVYDSERTALNALFHGLYYVEKEMKDLKLGVPLGLQAEKCASVPCPDQLESRYAKVSTDNLRWNLAGFRRLFEGCGANGDGVGFDDWLREIGAGDLADRMLAALAGAEAAVDQLEIPLEECLITDIDRVRGVYEAVRALTTLLKTEFVTLLNLDRPASAGDDND